METQAALVGADSGVELYTETAVYLHLTVVVNPRHAEHDNALGLGDALQNTGSLILRVGLDHGLQSGQNLGDSLNELRLMSVLLADDFQLFADIRHGQIPLRIKIHVGSDAIPEPESRFCTSSSQCKSNQRCYFTISLRQIQE